MATKNLMTSLLLLIAAKSVMSDCQIHELFITFGDSFTSIQDPSSYWVISLTLRNTDGIEICSAMIILLYTGRFDELEGTSIDPYESIRYSDPKIEYPRTNYRFKVTKGQGSPFKTWSVSNIEHSEGPYFFP